MELPLADELTALSDRISGIMLGTETVEEAVQSLAAAAKKAVPQASGAGATLIEGVGQATTSGATDPIVVEADRLQYELGEGPCLSAWADQRVIRMDNIQDEVRWPRGTWAVAGLELAFMRKRSAGNRRHSDRGAEGVLLPAWGLQRQLSPTAGNVRPSRSPNAGQRRGRRVSTTLSAELVGALAARDAIKTASGILMERLGVSNDRALEAKLHASRRDNKTLSDVAQGLIDEHAKA